MSDRAPGEETEALRARWDRRHRAAAALPKPAAILTENRHLLPARGLALDLACGLGANAVVLARQGLAVQAWDLSPVAVARVAELASRLALPISAEVRDLGVEPLPEGRFDCIVVANFLERALAPGIMAALRPGGLLFYQTFAREAVGGCGPSNPSYRLAPNELLHLFQDLTLRLYREEGLVGDLDQGTRGLVQLIGQRPLAGPEAANGTASPLSD